VLAVFSFILQLELVHLAVVVINDVPKLATGPTGPAAILQQPELKLAPGHGGVDGLDGAHRHQLILLQRHLVRGIGHTAFGGR